ncbi:MAG: polyphenol oxidase family protein, partial [Thermoanaerobaculia bacterium]|nr:polyphenol oxidase family protein [Thermoanaerobaculia bacterium]
APEPAPDRGLWCWGGELGRARFRFYGKPAESGAGGGETEGDELAGHPVAWLRQRHSKQVLEAHGGGELGDGDAAFAVVSGLALRVVTADCVPVVLVADDCVAVVHAGWRGIAADVVGATLDRWPSSVLPTAIVGPSIGPCCYEVGDDVAARVVTAAGSGDVSAPGPRGRPHLDLRLAVHHQLDGRVAAIATLPVCTRCSDSLWSYRREGPRAGRNLALAWLEP